MKHYQCVKDLQGSDYCVGMIKSANGWRNYLTQDLDRDIHKELLNRLNNKNGKSLMKYLGEVWGLEFKEE